MKKRNKQGKIGKWGEEVAVKYLHQKGYKVLERNYYFRDCRNLKRGEIDIIAKKDDVVSFIEVKTLKNPGELISPEEKVNAIKRKKLRKTAESWLIKKKIPLDSKWQIDVIAIELRDKKVKINHFKNVVFE